MFDFDSLREILSTIKKNKMRTFLTGFAVAWGIFMLIILLASGNGLENGVKSNFSGRATNSVALWPGNTTMPYKGMPSGRSIRFDDKDYYLLKDKISEVEYVSATVYQSVTLSYGQEYGGYTLEGISPDMAYINNLEVKQGKGRFVNELDIQNRRKVIVIDEEIRKVLFKNEDALGRHVLANNIAYQVVGIYENKEQRGNNSPAYIPFTTAQMLYSQGYGFGRIDFTVKGLKTVKDNEQFIESLREKMGQLHTFNPDDKSALRVWNMAENVAQTEGIFRAITFFIWIIGLASLMAGIVGVGNIMLITVKERTREIGIRKAIGATPISVLKLIIFESILITTAAGYVGMLIGIGITEGISTLLAAGGASGGPSVFSNPTVDVGTVLAATGVLIVAGVLAGLIPALKATKVSPIEAMRAE